MSFIDSQALILLRRLLNLEGPIAAQTELLDDSVTQTFDIAQIARRSLVPPGSEGLYTVVLENVHAAAGALESRMDVYNTGASNFGGYPQDVPDNMDVWLVSVSATMTTTQTLDACAFVLEYPANQMGIGVDATPAAVVPEVTYECIAYFDVQLTAIPSAVGLQEILASNSTGALTHAVTGPMPRRLRKGTVLTWHSDVSGAGATTAKALAVIALAPKGLGQDVA